MKIKRIASLSAFVFLLSAPVGMFAAEISTRSSIDYEATGVYAGVRTIGTLPTTSTTTVYNTMDRGSNCEITPQQKNVLGSWVNASSTAVMGTQSHKFSLYDNAPTKLFIKAHGGSSVDVHGHFND